MAAKRVASAAGLGPETRKERVFATMDIDSDFDYACKEYNEEVGGAFDEAVAACLRSPEHWCHLTGPGVECRLHLAKVPPMTDEEWRCVLDAHRIAGKVYDEIYCDYIENRLVVDVTEAYERVCAARKAPDAT